MALTVIDLLWDGAKRGKEIKACFTPLMSKARYLKAWGKQG